MRTTIRTLLPLCILTVLVAAVFGNNIFNGFVWDDNLYILKNPVYANFDVVSMFTSLGNKVEYLPVRDMSYAIDYTLWNTAAGFHLSNVVYYCLNVIAVYFLTSLFAAASKNGNESKDHRIVGFIAASLFAAHPLHSEVASFLTCRNALLSTLFFLFSCIFYMLIMYEDRRARRTILFIGALACFTLSLLSKANGIILPLLLVFITLFVSRRHAAKDFVPIIPFFVLSGAAFWLFTRIALTVHIIDYSKIISGHNSLNFLVDKILYIIFFYVKKFVVPFDYSAAYSLTLDPSWLSPVNIGTVLALTGAIIVAIRFRKTKPYLLTGIAWYLITLIPVLNIFPTDPIVADRYAFLPSVAFAFIIASAVVDFVSGNPRLQIVAWGGVVILTGWWSYLAISQNAVWKTEESLWEHTTQVSPNNAWGHVNLGRVQFGNGDFKQAFIQFDTARHLNFNDPHYDFFEGILLLARQDREQAFTAFNRSLQSDPQFIEALFQIGLILEERGDHKAAAIFFKKVLDSPKPDNGNFKSLSRERLNNIRRVTGNKAFVD